MLLSGASRNTGRRKLRAYSSLPQTQLDLPRAPFRQRVYKRLRPNFRLAREFCLNMSNLGFPRSPHASRTTHARLTTSIMDNQYTLLLANGFRRAKVNEWLYCGVQR